MAEMGLRDFRDDGTGYHVAGGKIRQFVVARHKCLALVIFEGRAFAAHGFGDEHARGTGHVEGGGVELHEFKVGELRPGAIRHGQAITGGDGGFEVSRQMRPLPPLAKIVAPARAP